MSHGYRVTSLFWMLLTEVCFESIPWICFYRIGLRALWRCTELSHIVAYLSVRTCPSACAALYFLLLLKDSWQELFKNSRPRAGDEMSHKQHLVQWQPRGMKKQTQMSQIWFYFWSWSNSRISASAKEKRRAHPSIMHSNFTLTFSQQFHFFL